MINWPLTFEDVFKISTRSLRYNYSHPYVIRNRFWLITIICERIIALLSFVSLLYSIIYHDFKCKMYAEAVKNGIMAIVAVTATFKHSILIRNRDSIKKLIDTLNKDYESAKYLPNDEKEIILKYARRGVNVCQFWLIAIGLTSFMFPVKAIILMAYHCFKSECRLVQMFDFTWPPTINDYKDTLIGFTGLFAFYFIFDMFSMSVYIGFDPLVPIFMLHTCGQLDLIGKNLGKIYTKRDIEDTKNNLKLINIKLEEIYRFVKSIQEIFMVLYEFNMKTTTFLIPFSAFQIVELICLATYGEGIQTLCFQSLREKDISLEFISFFFGALLHFYIPCYYSNLLMEKSNELRQSIYSCGWEMEPNIQVRKTILLMMTRTSVPLVIETIFYPICLNTYAEMTRQAYGIFNIMNAAWG